MPRPGARGRLGTRAVKNVFVRLFVLKMLSREVSIEVEAEGTSVHRQQGSLKRKSFRIRLIELWFYALGRIERMALIRVS